ncbi:signal transduction histidine kinase [Neorhizobium huautlense]|uniref:Signal transduction histidine kinase n=1 Tax=Neorhizobium huautlense TaxID=67774 RepID=A0ABT9Q1N8_9HYPH|nr:hypothetical protein [Neorhizobium huautlense]MDP9840629.1 signal transduction histidine kinase [Neorhizobium huautlense]
MRFIPTVLHGVLDYLVGVVLIVLPFALGTQGPTLIALIALGLFAIAYSLFTDYELGAVRFLRVRFHLALDIVFGIIMLFIPTVFDLPAAIEWLVYVIGFLAILLATITKIRATGTAS